MMCISVCVSPCAHKRVDLVVAAFNRLGLPLLVVRRPGTELFGTDGWSNGDHPGRQSQQQVELLLARCRAYVYAGLEDFGTAAEAMASGAPVIGLGRGGFSTRCDVRHRGWRMPQGCCFPIRPWSP